MYLTLYSQQVKRSDTSVCIIDVALMQTEQELAAQKMTPEEVKRRREAMAKNNALLFYQEQKAKRVKKIKSKAYHRHLKKQTEKAHAALGNNDLDDPNAAMVRSTV